MRKRAVLLVVLALAAIGLGRAFAKAGDIDPGYGNGGLALAGYSPYAAAHTAILDTAGRLVAAGYTLVVANENIEFAVARLTTGGAPDTSFGGSGRVVTDFGPGLSNAWSMAQRPDGGGYLVAGESCNTDYEACRLAVAAYGPGGGLDSTFGNGGRVLTPGPGLELYAWAVHAAMQPDGKLVTANVGDSGGAPKLALVRYLTNGDLDGSFSGDGIALFGAGSSGMYPFSVRRLADGRFLVAGALGTPAGRFQYQPTDAFIARYTASGGIDSTFGSGGIVIWDNDGEPVDGLGMVAGTDGWIYQVAGVMRGGSGVDCIVRRFHADGRPDATFGNGGRAFIATPDNDYCLTVELDPGGRPVISGSVYAPSQRRGAEPWLGGRRAARTATRDADITKDSMLVARLTITGALDTTFGTGGIVVYTSAVGPVYGWTGVVQPDFKPIVVGELYLNTSGDFAAARFLGAGPAQPPPGPNRTYLPMTRR